jgi:hypothetical protein
VAPPASRDRPLRPTRLGVAVGLAVLLATGAGGVAVWRAAVGPPPDTGSGPAAVERPLNARTNPSPSATPTPSPPAEARFTIVAAGDVLPHQSVLESARTTDGFDFSPLLAPLDAWVAGADLALCHLEVPVAPAGSEPTGYPSFGAPASLLEDLRAQGWDGCSTASNHALDRGRAGLDATLDVFDGAGLGHVGTARTPLEADAPQLYRLSRAGRDVTVAHLAATYGVNGHPSPRRDPWTVTDLDPATLVARAAAARAAGADLVVVSVHCCEEYRTAPTPRQLEVAEALAASGTVDLLIGHHAHVPQPVARLDGGPGGAGMWTLYGLGNLLSNQDAECCPPETSSGLLATAHVAKAADGPARVTGVEWTGVTVDRHGGHLLHALPEVTTGTPTLPPEEVAARAARVAAAAGAGAPARTAPVTPTGPPPTVVPRAR